MDIFAQLHQEHQQVSQLIDELAEAPQGSGQDLFRQVREMIASHSALEETLFYPALKEADQTRAIVEESLSEHHQVAEILGRMDAVSGFGEGWIELVRQLKDAVTHHVREEEKDLFPKARKLLSAEKAQHLLERWRALKRTTPAGRTQFDDPMTRQGTAPTLERGLNPSQSTTNL